MSYDRALKTVTTNQLIIIMAIVLMIGGIFFLMRRDNEPPVAVLKVNLTQAEKYKPIQFSASESTDNVRIASYNWGFGDRTTGTGEVVVHAYSEVGDFTVTLTVIDEAGNKGSETVTVEIRSAAPVEPVGRLEITPDDYKTRGLTLEPQVWEDAIHISGNKVEEYEWWYFDAHMKDGSFIAGTYQINIEDSGPRGFLRVDITTPEGDYLKARLRPSIDPNTISRTKADIRLGSSYLRGDLDTYKIFLDPKQANGLGWDLTLERIAPSYRPGTGYFSAGDNYFAWFVAVPSGSISGTLTYKGKTVEVEGNGYHDHNWGNIKMATLMIGWWWGRANLNNLAVVAADIFFDPQFGGANVPIFAIFHGKDTLLDTSVIPETITVVEENIGPHPDPENPDPIAESVIFIYDDGDERASFRFDASNLLASDKLSSSDPKRSPWYTRFESEVELISDEQILNGVGTLEFMDFR